MHFVESPTPQELPLAIRIASFGLTTEDGITMLNSLPMPSPASLHVIVVSSPSASRRSWRGCEVR